MSAIGASIGYFFTCASTIVTIDKTKKEKMFIYKLAIIGVIFSIGFIILQLIPVPGLTGVHFGKESYIMLIIWIIIGEFFFLSKRSTN